jgi:hypothetical protein
MITPLSSAGAQRDRLRAMPPGKCCGCSFVWAAALCLTGARAEAIPLDENPLTITAAEPTQLGGFPAAAFHRTGRRAKRFRAPGVDRDAGVGIVMALEAVNYALTH